MPSSTSNSKSRAPSGPWLATWLVGLLFAAAIFTGLEVFWRGKGHKPSIVDTPALWAAHRSNAYGAPRETIVLAGGSRIQLDIDTATVRRMLPNHQLIQLAIQGTHPVGTLRDLAEDEAFRGIVIASGRPQALWRRNWNSQSEYISYFHRDASFNNLLNSRISAWFQQHLVTINPRLNMKHALVRYIRFRRFPNIQGNAMEYDRSRKGDFRTDNVAKQREMRIDAARQRAKGWDPIAKEATPEHLREDFAEIEEMVQKIESRGGRVAFVRFPSTDENWEIDQRLYPRARYWDVLVDSTQATTIHFEDVDGLADFDCPDTSHLDYRDTPAFTESLIDELKKRGLFDNP